MKRKIEILAPAGSFEALKAGIQAGADAVYVGGTMFGARAYAENFDKEGLLRAVDYVHLRRKKIYLTVNTLLTDDDIKQKLHSFLAPCYREGMDAVIVQDVGVMRFIHGNFPNMDIHASTQMSVTMAQGAELLMRYGVNRIIPARELSLDEIKRMRGDTNLELEVFVHGALCYSYSGQCHMSAALGGRSGNKGMCAGPCRLPYVRQGEKGYFLSLKDLCSLSLIGGLVGAGVDSFKIEGRMKKPEYVALTTHLYRKYTDYCMELGVEGYQEWVAKEPKEYKEDVRKLMDVYNRGGFTSGYYKDGKDSTKKTMLSIDRPNHNGVYVGKVTKMEKSIAHIQLMEEVHGGDVLEFRDAKGEVTYEYTVGKEGVIGRMAKTNTGRSPGVKVGNTVYRTKNKRLLDEIASHYMKEKKIRVKAEFTAHWNERVRLSLMEGDVKVDVWGGVVGKAEKIPLSETEVRDKLTRTGNTPFVCKELIMDMDEGIFLPLSELNTLRRKAFDELRDAVIRRKKRQDLENEKKSGSLDITCSMDNPTDEKQSAAWLTVSVCTKEQWEVVRNEPMVERIYLSTEDLGLSGVLNMVGGNDIKTYYMLPMIFREKTYCRYQRWWEEEGEGVWPRINGFVIRNLEEYHFVSQLIDPYQEKEWVLNDNMYVENEEAYRFWLENGINRAKETLLYGYVPLMVSSNCLLRNKEGCRKRKRCQIITNEKKREFKVVNHCDSCYNTIYGDRPYSLLSDRGLPEREALGGAGPSFARLDLTLETGEEARRILRRAALCYKTQTFRT